MVTPSEFETFAKKLKYETISNWSDWRYQIEFKPTLYTFSEMKKLLKTNEIDKSILAFFKNQYITNSTYYKYKYLGQEWQGI